MCSLVDECLHIAVQLLISNAMLDRPTEATF